MVLVIPITRNLPVMVIEPGMFLAILALPILVVPVLVVVILVLAILIISAVLSLHCAAG
jgi:hypothetical protein